MSMLLYPSCDTGRSRIGVGSRGGAPGSSGVLGNKLLSDEHAFIPYLTLVVTIGVGFRGAPGSSGVLGVMSMLLCPSW